MRTKNLFRSEEGNALIEFALLAPVFFMLVAGLVEFVLYQYKCYAVNHVAYESARRLMTGEVQNTVPPAGQTPEDVFRTQVCSDAGALVDCTQIDFDVRHFAAIPAIQYTTPIFNAGGRATNFTYDPGTADEYTVVQVTYPHTFVTPFMAQMFGGGDATKPAIVSSFIVVKGEPWE
jgi:Flp pilus assembly protein TadG